MDTLSAFARGQANRGKPAMVFDWGKAARLIRERGATLARAGLRDDWEYTGGAIFEDGKPADDYTYLASTWAVPELEIDGEIVECFLPESETEWDAHTKWPPEALAILKGEREPPTANVK